MDENQMGPNINTTPVQRVVREWEGVGVWPVATPPPPRACHDLHDAYPQAEPLVQYSLDSSNPGRRLLEQQGWVAHTGLGKDGSGILAPIATRFKADRRGIGSGIASAKRRTHTSETIEEVKEKEAELRREEKEKGPRGFLTARQRAEAQKREKKKEQAIHELLYTDTWEYLRPGEMIQL